MYRIKKEVHDQLTKINDDYLKQVQDINKQLIDEERKLNDEYNKAYSDRISQITNVVGVFDEFVSRFEGTGRDLLNNLRSQVTGIQEWRSVLESLWGKIDDQALMEELEALGPKAVGELQALNSLSESELAEYVSLYNQKFAEAREQATHELEGMKENTEYQINELRKVANKKLDELQSEWTKSIRKITETTNDEFKSLESIGKQAGQNLLDGLSSMEGVLVAKARSIAEAVNNAMAGALGTAPINTMSFDTQLNGGIFTQPTQFGASGGTVNNNNTDSSKTNNINQNVVINSRDDAESIARAVDRVNRQLAFQMG